MHGVLAAGEPPQAAGKAVSSGPGKKGSAAAAAAARRAADWQGRRGSRASLPDAGYTRGGL